MLQKAQGTGDHSRNAWASEASKVEGRVLVEPHADVLRNLLPGSVHFIGLGTLGSIP